MIKPLLVLLLLLTAAGASSAQAQDNGGSGLPSGQMPWSPISFPFIASPTPLATNVPTATSTPAGTPSGLAPTPTNTPAPGIVPTINVTTGFENFDGGGIANQMSTLQALMNTSNTTPIDDVSGGHFNLGQTANLAANGTTLVSYIKGLTYLNVGFMTPLLQLLILQFAVRLALTLLGFVIPLGATLIGIMRKALNVILEFIPL